MADFTPNDWSSVIAKAIQCSEETVPDGFLTAAETCLKMGLARARTNEVLRQLIESGLAEMKLFRIKAGGAGVRPVPHYHLIASKKTRWSHGARSRKADRKNSQPV